MFNRSITEGMRHKILVTIGLFLLWALAVIAVVLAEAAWFAHPPVQRGDLASIEKHLVQQLNDAVANQKLGSAALVLVQGGKIVAEHGFGVANVETQAPVKTDQTLFILGSVSKAVTAWGVMKLVEEGKLGLDEPIIRHLKRWRFPGSEAYRDKVTVRHLLSHTAGIDDGFRAAGFLPGETMQTLEESLTRPKDMNGGEGPGVVVVREPGTVMSYSASAGNSILQLLIEEVTNRRFAEYMKETVLQPLGMTKSSYDLDAIVAEGRAQDLAPSFDAGLKPHPHRGYTAQAAVALRVTARDLAQFVLAYTKDNLVLKPETLKQMMTPQPGTAGTWGLGQTLYVENDAGGYVVGHSGAAFPAQGASMRVNPATGNGFVLTVSGGSGVTNQLVHHWLYWETGKVTFEARRELVYARLVPASVAILLGAIGIALWNLWRKTKMKKAPLVVALLSFVGLSACQATQVVPARAMVQSPVATTGALEITYLANEGFMIAGGGRKVLIDALFGAGLRGYPVVSTAQRELLEQARAPFADVDAVFATHFHDDHFNAESVLAHLTHNPQAFFFSTNQAADKLKATGKFDAVKTRIVAQLPKEGERIHSGHRGLHVQLLNIHHGRGRPTENLGFIVEIAGKRILHIGDSEAEAAVFQKYELVKDRIDVAFLPYWYFLEDDKKQAVRAHIQPRHIVLMHLPPDIDGYGGVKKYGGWQRVWPQIKSEFPSAVYFEKELEKKSFD